MLVRANKSNTILVIGLVLLSGSLFAAMQEPRRSPPSAPTDTERELKRLNDSLSEVRRDQLNYQIERDLLKETYSSNLQTINLILAMILGTFAILGYLGLRSLGTLRADFQRDLEQFRARRADLEAQLKDLEIKQSQANIDVEKLRAENEEQDRRLRGLEVREKVGTLISQSNFGLALDYVNVGLQMTPTDPVMMRQRMHCLSKLGRLAEAITAYEEFLKTEPNDQTAITNLAEFYLLAGRFEDYHRLIGTHRDVIDRQSPILFWYFEATKLLLKGNTDALKAHLAELPAGVPREKTPKILNWNYAEARAAVAGRTDLPGRKLFFATLDFLEGKLDADGLNAVITAPDA